MNAKPTHVDLFTGIGGFALAAHWAGFETIAFCEKDNWCQQVIRNHWPKVPIHGNIRTFPGHLYRGANLITGGFPCQPFSQCGKRRGKNDDRYLWPPMLEVIKVVRPTWVVIENVNNLIRMALKTIVSDLEAAGYESVVFRVPACGIGAPHRRQRAVVVSKSHDTDADSLRSYREAMHEAGQGCQIELQDEQVGIPRQVVPAQVWEKIDPRVLGVDDGISSWLDQNIRCRRIQGLGNAVVPLLAYQFLKEIAEIDSKAGSME